MYIIILYRDEKHIVETKLWRGEKHIMKYAKEHESLSRLFASFVHFVMGNSNWQSIFQKREFSEDTTLFLTIAGILSRNMNVNQLQGRKSSVIVFPFPRVNELS